MVFPLWVKLFWAVPAIAFTIVGVLYRQQSTRPPPIVQKLLLFWLCLAIGTFAFVIWSYPGLPADEDVWIRKWATGFTTREHYLYRVVFAHFKGVRMQ
jgi:hypothetical protein